MARRRCGRRRRRASRPSAVGRRPAAVAWAWPAPQRAPSSSRGGADMRRAVASFGAGVALRPGACGGSAELACLRTGGSVWRGDFSPQLVTGVEALAELVSTVVPWTVMLSSVLPDELAAVCDAPPQETAARTGRAPA